MGDVKAIRVSSLSFSEVAQAFHDDRVVELTEQLEMGEKDREGRLNHKKHAMGLTVDDL